MPPITATPFEVEFDEVVDRLGLDHASYVSASRALEERGTKQRLKGALLVSLLNDVDSRKAARIAHERTGRLSMVDLNRELTGAPRNSCLRCDGLAPQGQQLCHMCVDTLTMERHEREQASRQGVNSIEGTIFNDEYTDEDELDLTGF